MLCYAFLKDYEKAYNLAKTIIDTANSDYSNKMQFIFGLLSQTVFGNGKTESTGKSPGEIKKIEVFPEQNRLCSHFAYVKLTIDKQRTIVKSSYIHFYS